MAPIRFCSLYLFLICSLISIPAHADWINMSGAENAPNIAEIYIEDDHIRLELEIFVNDIGTFVDILPDSFFEDKKDEIPSLADRLKIFAADTFQFVTETGKKLPVELRLIEPRLRKERYSPFAGSINITTGRPVPGPPEDKRVLYAELIYPFSKKPQSLTIIPPMKDGLTTVAIGFILYHKNAPVVDFRFLSQPSLLYLDWDDPWYSSFEKKTLKRWQQSGLMTYLYVEPFEVRHETLVRVKDLSAWIDLGLRGKEFIEIDEFEVLKKRIGEFLLSHSKVLIDGQSLPPILDRTSFVKYTMTRTYFYTQPEQIPVNTAMVGVIVTYITKGIPQEVTVDWDLFSDRIQKVPTSAVDPAGPFPSFLTPDENVLVWKNFLKNYTIPTVAELVVNRELITIGVPMVSMACFLLVLIVSYLFIRQRKAGKSILVSGSFIAVLLIAGIFMYPYFHVSVSRPAMMVPKISNEKAVSVLQTLLKNVYRSFDFREENDVYDRLATSVHGDLLSQIYLQNRKSMIVTQAGGAQARVKTVDIQSVDVNSLATDPLGLLFHAQWTAEGTVGHWGHIHTRKNQYDANITVKPVEGVWKIVDLELIEEKRIDPYAPQPKS